MWGQHRHCCHPPVPPQRVLPPPLPFCPSTPWTPPKTKASLWSWPTGSLPATFFACFLSAMGAQAPWSAPPPPADSGGSELSLLCCPAQGPPTATIPPVGGSGPRRESPRSSAPGAAEPSRASGVHPSGLWLIWSVPREALMFSSIKMGSHSHLWGCRAD